MRRSQVARAQRRGTGQPSGSQSRPARTVTELTAEATTADRRGGAPCTAAVEADNLITNTAGLESRGRAGKPDAEGMPIREPEATLAEIRDVAAGQLHGAHLRRRLDWRYSLLWHLDTALVEDRLAGIDGCPS